MCIWKCYNTVKCITAILPLHGSMPLTWYTYIMWYIQITIFRRVWTNATLVGNEAQKQEDDGDVDENSCIAQL